MIGLENINFKNRLIKTIRDGNSCLVPIKTNLPPKITKFHNIKCVLFDVYGTLFISGAGDISHSTKEYSKINVNKILDSCNFRVVEKEAGGLAENLFFDFIKLSHDKSKAAGCLCPEIDVIEVWESVLSTLVSAKKIEGILTLKNVASFALKYEIEKNPVWPMPNLREALEYMSEKDLYLGIISNAQFFTPLYFEAFLKKSLDSLGFQKDLLVWSYEHMIAKPSLGLFNLVSDMLRDKYSVFPQEVLYIGNDMLNDIKPACNIGFRTALFAGDKRSLRTRKDLIDCQGISPDVIITDLIQICDIF